jgi:hypothetical protein
MSHRHQCLSEVNLPVAIAMLRDACSVLERFQRGLVALKNSDRELCKWFVIDPAPAMAATEAVLTVKPSKRLAALITAFEAANHEFNRIERAASPARMANSSGSKHGRRLVQRRPASKRGG